MSNNTDTTSGRPIIDLMLARSESHVPGEPGVWALIIGDMLIFTLFFLTFIYERGEHRVLFASAHRTMAVGYGMANTLLLLSSSWLVATAVRSARERDSRRVRPRLAGAIACGAGFVLIKIVEYRAKIATGAGLASDDFYTLYFMLTGIHLLHVLIGLGVLAALLIYARRGPWHTRSMALLESGATFWHLVDLLWIVLFALFYLVS